MLADFSAPGFLVQTPLGPRKSGMPLSVEMPAPVSTATASASGHQPAGVVECTHVGASLRTGHSARTRSPRTSIRKNGAKAMKLSG